MTYATVLLCRGFVMWELLYVSRYGVSLLVAGFATDKADAEYQIEANAILFHRAGFSRTDRN